MKCFPPHWKAEDNHVAHFISMLPIVNPNSVSCLNLTGDTLRLTLAINFGQFMQINQPNEKSKTNENETSKNDDSICALSFKWIQFSFSFALHQNSFFVAFLAASAHLHLTSFHALEERHVLLPFGFSFSLRLITHVTFKLWLTW